MSWANRPRQIQTIRYLSEYKIMKALKPAFLCLLISLLLSCTEERPSGSVAEKTITTLNLVSKPPPKGNPSELFSMLSQNFISEFSEEIELAKSIDSIELRSLPMMKMLRILSLKNAYSKQLTTLDNKSIITNWIESSGKGFPLKSGSRYYYSENLSTENKI